MNNIVFLYSKDVAAEKAKIEETISDNSIYVLDNKEVELNQYIDCLHDEYELSNKVLHKFRICKEFDCAGKATLYNASSKQEFSIDKISTLLEKLQEGTYYSLVIEDDDRALLADIMQQLIYIDYPITEIDIKLRKEFKDAARTHLFMKNINELSQAAESAVNQLTELCSMADDETRTDLYRTRAEALMAYKRIQAQIQKAQDVEMKVAVAASKKTGKSVIVNCMIRDELAPTSLELATPNSCVYKRSEDDKFHLTYNGKTEDFSDSNAIYNRVREEFKKAQNQADTKFAIPDMEIAYVTNGNNFDSYTIYDTPGPDAAGTAHAESAKKAIDECDVALFAMDYSKYLTDSEKNYLGEIKSLFAKKKKFHSLVFVLNKMDLALNDKGTQSRIKTLDFIRMRLRDIDKNYGDCIVFGTSAQDYFYTLDLEKIAAEKPEYQQLVAPECDLYTELRPATSDEEDEDTLIVLSYLDGEVGKIKRQMGYSHVNVDTVQRFSGIPQLLNYVSYVARSKAREEIVNNITYTIDIQCRALQAIIDKVANIEELIGKNQSELRQIEEILEQYASEIKSILSNDLTADDMDLDEQESTFAAAVKKYQADKTKGFPIDLKDFLRYTRSNISAIRDMTVQKALWADIKAKQTEKIKKQEGQIVMPSELAISTQEINEIVENYAKRSMEKRMQEQEKSVENLGQSLQAVISKRTKKIQECSDNCKILLEKNNCYLGLPKFPVFDVAIEKPHLNLDNFHLEKIDLTSTLKPLYNQLGWWEQFWRNLKDAWKYGTSMDRKEVRVASMSDDELDEALKAAQATVYDSVIDANIVDTLKTHFEKLEHCVEKVENNLEKHFHSMNEDCTKVVELFKGSIDDRKDYQNNLENLEDLKRLIVQIEQASQDFLECWEHICDQ